MKRSKRQKNAIIVGVIFNILVLLSMAYYLMFNLREQVEDFEEVKTTTEEKVEEINTISKEGMSFNDFKTKSPKNPDTYLTYVLTKVDEPFYNEFFKNTKKATYNEFITGFDVFGSGSGDSVNQIDSVLDTVIPSYTTFNKSILYNTGALTEFKFINHIEQLLYSFSLEFEGYIGIGKIVPYESPKDIRNKSADLEENIFSIPFLFDVIGDKGNIIDFIHYLENVGTIVYDEETIGVAEDNFITDRFGREKLLNGEKRSDDYNIYFHQLADISKIQLEEYPYGKDVSEKYSTGNLFAYIREVQGTDDYSAKIEVNFYVKGVPSYEMKDEITKFLVRYDKLKKDVIKILKDKRATRARDLETVSYFDKMGSLNIYLESLEKDIKKIKLNYKKKDNLNDIYKEVITLGEIITKAESIYNNPDYVEQVEVTEEEEEVLEANN